MINRYQGIISNLENWGKSSEKMSAAIIIGSQARADHSSDEYSDLDVIIFTEDPDFFIKSDQWLNRIGNFHVSFVENSIDGQKEKRVLFENALDVDFVIVSNKIVSSDLTRSDAIAILGHGYRILVDKIGVQEILSRININKQTYIIKSEKEYQNIVNDFWYHSVWTAKKLMRAEFWTAKMCLDSYMKWKLLAIIELYEHAKHGVQYNTWHSGRFIEEWAEPRIIEKLSCCFSHYNKNDIKAALLSTMDLFRLIVVETAEILHFEYPKGADEYSSNWVNKNL